MPSHAFRFVLLAALSAISVRAQPASATFRAGLLDSWSIGYSYSSNADLTRNGPTGDVAVNTFNISTSSRSPISKESLFVYGANFTNYELSSSPGTPLPDRLSEASLNLGVINRFSPAWAVSAFARPGFYGDFTRLSDSFNVPVLALANYARTQNLVWSFGLRVDAFSETPVLPVAGVRWQFAPAWTFNLGFPQAGFVFKASPTSIWRAGVSFQGGSFRISDNLGTPAPGVKRLANTLMDYREVRAGIGADFTLPRGFSLNLDAGIVTDRQFDYYDRDYGLNGDPAAYGAISLSAKF